MVNKIAIIGGGISGISLARMVNAIADVTVFEQREQLGGLINCKTINGYLYHKVGGHVFNSKNQEVLDWFWQFFNKDTEFIKAKRTARIFINNELIGYPIEDHLHRLDEQTVRNVINELLDVKPGLNADNFEQFLRKNFGDTLYQLYFKPYNEKIWNADLSKVPLQWLEGKLPMPKVRDIVINNILRKEEDNMVHSFFYYPRHNGSQFIIDRLAEGVNTVKNFAVKTITAAGDDEIYINESGPFQKVVFTGDVRTLPSVISNGVIPVNLANKIKQLRSNGTTNVLCKCDKNDNSWVYIPEKNYKAHRIIYTGNFSPQNNVADDAVRSSCVVEFSNYLSEQEAREEIKRLPGDLEYVAYNYEPNSYVIQDTDTREMIAELKGILRQKNIFLIGRFSEWEYYNMDKAIEAAFLLKKQLI